MRLFQCQFDSVTFAQAVAWAREHLCNRDENRGYIATVNVSILMALRSNQKLRQFIERSSLTVADGQPIIWLSRLLGTPLPERIAGVDLVPALCQAAVDSGESVYFLGSKQDVVDDVVERMKTSTPGLQVAGYDNGYFSNETAFDRAKAVGESGAGLLILGLGVPLQEQFLEEHWDVLNVKLAIPIGGAFDMISRRKPRAAQWIQTSGLEWLWRLYLEPRRLAKRYFVSNSQFLALAAFAVFKNSFRRLRTIPNTNANTNATTKTC